MSRFFGSRVLFSRLDETFSWPAFQTMRVHVPRAISIHPRTTVCWHARWLVAVEAMSLYGPPHRETRTCLDRSLLEQHQVRFLLLPGPRVRTARFPPSGGHGFFILRARDLSREAKDSESLGWKVSLQSFGRLLIRGFETAGKVRRSRKPCLVNGYRVSDFSDVIFKKRQTALSFFCFQ